MVCPWPFLASTDSTTTQSPETGKTFAQGLADSGDIQLSQLPIKVVMSDTVRVKISQDEYEHGIEDCKRNLHARLNLNKGDPPLTTQALKLKLTRLWLNL